MLNIDFYNMFININFDNILYETNNPLVNSKEFYLNYKKQYFDKTNQNYSRFLRINAELQKLKESQHKIKNQKYFFVYLDKKSLETLKNDLKKIIISQQELFNNFKHYIEKLNKDVNLFSNIPTKNRNIFSFFNKSKENTTKLKRTRSNASIKSNKSTKSIQSFKSFI